MSRLRIIKRKVAFLVALADLSRIFDGRVTTAWLSRLAEASVAAAIDPSWHETVAAPVHEPWFGVAEPNVTDPGSVSVTTTFDATLVDDAGFATVMV